MLRCKSVAIDDTIAPELMKIFNLFSKCLSSKLNLHWFFGEHSPNLSKWMMPYMLTTQRGGDNGNVGDPTSLWRLMELMKICRISSFN